MRNWIKKLFKYHQCQRCTEKFWFNKYETSTCNFKKCPKSAKRDEPMQYELFYAKDITFHEPPRREETLTDAILTGAVPLFEAASAVSEFLMDTASGVVDIIDEVADIEDIVKNGIGDSFD